jgi:hypothetical protein
MVDGQRAQVEEEQVQKATIGETTTRPAANNTSTAMPMSRSSRPPAGAR